MSVFAHCGMLTIESDEWEESVRKIESGLLGLVGVVPGLVNAKVGISARVRPDTASVMFVMEFDSEESWQNYGAHPAHQAVVADAISPVLVDKKFLQTRNWATRALK